jgi:NAD(P)-dependent dehydrogenase (short-subunit alcohol dehydrogenase family)
MIHADSFRLDGKRALVVGGATGMGAATAVLAKELGAEVIVMDHAPVTLDGVTSIHLDLRDKGSIEGAVEQLDEPIDALFSCAGAADGTPGIEKINFIGHRHLIDRALDASLLPRGSAIGMISSAAGLAWEKNLDRVKDYLAADTFESAVAWIEANPGTADYMWSKQALCGYVAQQARPMLSRGIRINAILPGPTDTPLAQANAELWLSFGSDFRDDVGIEASRPDEQAAVLVFLCTPAASYLNGQTIITDAGYVASGITGSFPEATAVVDFLYGRY